MSGVLSYRKFGQHLLETGDLDPVYIMLVESGLHRDPPRLQRWCLAYWCFYHVGVASRIAEASPRQFYRLMKQADRQRWPRGAERRHFRGRTSANGIDCLHKFGSPEKVVEYMLEPCTFSGITERVKEFSGFGPWIAFKIADMAHSVFGLDVDYSDCTLGIYKDPRQGAALILHGDWRAPITDKELQRVVNKLQRQFKNYLAPPFYKRPVGVMEVETILCKYKSHYKGRYPLFKDSREIYEALEGWGDLAEELRCHVVNREQWSS